MSWSPGAAAKRSSSETSLLAAEREYQLFSPTNMDYESGLGGYNWRRKCVSSFPRLSPKLLLFTIAVLSGCGLLAFRHSDNLPNLPSSDSLNKWSIGFTQQQKSLLEEELVSQREQLSECTADARALRHASDQAADSTRIRPDDVRTWPSPTPELPLGTTLQDRIAAWNSTPVADASTWARYNLETCPPSITDVNKLWGFIAPLEIPGGPWQSWWSDPQRVRDTREDMFKYLLDAEQQGLLDEKHYGKGRGIIFSAGNSDTFERVLITMRIMRHTYNTWLPVEIFSFPGEDCPPELRPEIEKLGGRLRILSTLHKDPSRVKNWHIKAGSLIESSFREVLYLDSDNTPCASLEGPDSIFNSAGFKETGAVFWPDYWKDVAHNPVWQIIGVQCRNEWEMEAGQLLIDKSKHLDALKLTEYMLVRYQTWFSLSDGDKDLFRYAMLALRKRWTVPGAFIGSASWGPDRPAIYCSHTLVQNDHLGEPLFIHANAVKKLPSEVPFSNSSSELQIWGMSKRADLKTSEPLDCDHLANVDRYGNGIKTAKEPASRRRAALEFGIRSWFRSTKEYLSCVDQRWDEPLSEDERLMFKYMDWMGPPSSDTIRFENPMIEELWKDNDRLKGFEAAFWKAGGKTAGANFG